MRKLAWLVVGVFFAACSPSNNNPMMPGKDGGGTMPGDMTVPANAVMLSSTAFPLGPGQEVFKCQDFANPFGGVDTDIAEFQSHMTPGSHHMLLFYQDNAVDIPLADCAPLQFQELPYGAQTPDNAITYPAGVAAHLAGTRGFHMQMHYLNATTNTVMVQVSVLLYKAAPGTVTQYAGVFFFNNLAVDIPAGGTQTITKTCTFPQAANVMFATAHTHKYTNTFTATLNGQMIYSTNSWDASPFQKYDPVLQVPAGAQVTWTCEASNPGSTAVTFGESAVTNEMCIFDGQYYPVADPAHSTIGCN